jgi:Skp family chaperone for outer membrane proteins
VDYGLQQAQLLVQVSWPFRPPHHQTRSQDGRILLHLHHFLGIEQDADDVFEGYKGYSHSLQQRLEREQQWLEQEQQWLEQEQQWLEWEQQHLEREQQWEWWEYQWEQQQEREEWEQQLEQWQRFWQ